MSDAMLSPAAHDAARQYIEAAARPLEIAMYRFHFGDGSPGAVLAALEEFQNEDGGFGHALEPDVRAPESSVLCTTVAFQHRRSVGAGGDDASSSKAISYLLDNLDRAEGHWRIIPASAEASPHAPWWNQAGRETALDAFSLNPTAEVLGHLYDHRHLVPVDVLELVQERVLARLAAAAEIEMHELLCLQRLEQTRNLPDAVGKPLGLKLRQVVRDTVALDPAEWEGYNLRPLQVVDGPESPLATGIEDAVSANLDYEIASQADDGSWAPTWSWGEPSTPASEQSRREWSGVVTLDKLLILQRFGRIQGLA